MVPPLFVAAVLVLVVFAVTPVGGRSSGIYLFGVSAALIPMAVTLRGRRDLHPWRLIAVGVALSASADWTRFVADAAGWHPSVWDPFDIMNFLAFAWFLAGMTALARNREPVDRRDQIIELWTVVIVVALTAWVTLMQPALERSEQVLADRVVASAYPALAVAMVAMSAWVLLVRGRCRSPELLLLMAGVVAWLLGNIGYAFQERLGLYDFGSARLVDGAWLAGSLFVSLAVVRAAAIGHLPMRRTEPRSTGWARVAIGSALVASPMLIEAVSRAFRGERPPYVLTAAAVALGALSVARTVRLKTENDQVAAVSHTAHRRAQALAANSSDAVVVIDRGGRLTHGEQNLQRLLGTDEPVAAGTDVMALVDPEDRAGALEVLARCSSSPGEVLYTEVRVVLPGLPPRWYAVRAVNLLADPAVEGLVVNVHDVDDRKQMEDELFHRAFHDALTGLPNRAFFQDRVGAALRRNGTSDDGCAALFLDLDGFKAVNDTLGHDVGDQLLQEVARRLRQVTTDEHTVARLGGDEFAVLVDTGSGAAAQAGDLAARILEVLSEGVELAGERIRPKASIGVAVANDGADASALLRNADLAMYQAKADGKGRYVVFDRAMEAGVRDGLRIERDLTTALDDGQLRLAFQPVVHLATRQLQGFEALIRWNHPTLGDVPPDRFIPVAESSGLIIPIGAWVLREACETMQRWSAEFPHDPPLTIAVNVSAHQLGDPTFDTLVTEVLDSCGLEPGRLVLEITETALIVQPDAVADRLGRLRALGVRLAIDDFGTGYSSLSYLRRFPVDIVKIDREFTQTIDDGSEVPAIVEGLLGLGRTLGLEVIAEGIETDAQLSGLRTHRCALGQGYYFSRPLESNDAEVHLAGSFSPSTASGPDRPADLGLLAGRDHS